MLQQAWLRIIADPKRFNRRCSLFALIVLAIFSQVVPRVLHPPYPDFVQYYSGGLAARTGQWDALYPISTSDTLNAGWAMGSSLKPQTKKLLVEHGAPTDVSRFISPPPAALLFIPFSLVKYPYFVRIGGLLAMLCVWRIAVDAGKTYELIIGKESAWAGAIVLIIVLTPRLYISALFGNVSMFIALCVGICAVDLLKPKDRLGPAALVLGATMKYFTLSLLPVYILCRRWKAVAQMAAIAAALIIVSVLVMGTGPWHEYFALSPTFDRQYGIDTLYAFLRMLLAPRLSDHAIVTIVHDGFLVPVVIVLSLLFFRVGKPSGPQVLAFAAGSISSVFLAAPIYWGHYFFSLLPFWGWLLWELQRAKTRLLWWTVIVTWLLLSLPMRLITIHFSLTPWLSNQFWGTILLIALSLYRLSIREQQAAVRD